MNTPSIDISQIEHFLSLQGSFCLVDWLLKENYLNYGHYEDWRYQRENFLDDKLDITSKDIKAVIKETKKACALLNLATQGHDYYSWNSGQSHKLKISKQQTIHDELSQQWLRPQDLPQLDLFMDNSEVIAENMILNALGARKFDHAQESLSRLTELNPNQKKLGEYQDLINYGQYISSTPDIEETNLAEELSGLENEVLPLANTVLKHNARDYLAFAWRRLSVNSEQRKFDPRETQLHQSYMLMQIPDWQATLFCLQEEKELFISLILLHRLISCYESMKQENEALLCWCLLMELDNKYCENIIEKKPTPLITSLWQDFWEVSDDNLIEFFPAFILSKVPGLIHHIDKFPAMKLPSTNAVIEAIRIRLEKGDEIPVRKTMQDINPLLLQIFMNA